MSGASKWLVCDVLKKAKQYFYRAPRGQNLKEADCKRRLDFALSMHNKIENHHEFDPRNCAFSDEAMGSPNANRKNFGFWRFKGRFDDWREKMISHKCYEEKVHTFVLLHWKCGALGPYFIEEIPQQSQGKPVLTLNAQRYLWLLQNRVIPDLKEALGPEDFAKCWWQQDGAPAHTTKEVLSYLRSVFHHRILSNCRDEFTKDWQHDWPAYSPDLNPLDYYFWSSLRTILNFRKYSGKAQLKENITDIVQNSIPLFMIKRAIDDFKIRLEACIECKGAHFEYNLKSFKVRRNKREEWHCEACGKSHSCPCDGCKERCLQRQLNQMYITREESMDWEDPLGLLADSAWYGEDDDFQDRFGEF